MPGDGRLKRRWSISDVFLSSLSAREIQNGCRGWLGVAGSRAVFLRVMTGERDHDLMVRSSPGHGGKGWPKLEMV